MEITMTEPITELSRIADILARTSEPALFETPIGQIGALFIAALFGYFAQALSSEREVVRQRIQQRKLLVSLLGDEITLRWNQDIAKNLCDLFKEFKLEKVKELCETRFHEDDLWLFKQCATNITLTTAFDDHAVVSQVIYVHVLIKDFCDGHATLCKDYEASNPVVLKVTWEYLKEAYEKLDFQMLRIFSRIEDEYNGFIDTSDFIRENHIDTTTIQDRINKVVARRLPQRCKADSCRAVGWIRR
jgi:hypothetical protein